MPRHLIAILVALTSTASVCAVAGAPVGGTAPAAAAMCAAPPVAPPVDTEITDAGFMPVAPERIADTRNGIGVAAAPVESGCVLTVPLAPAQPPADAVAVALTVTSDRAEEVGYVSAFACGSGRTGTSNLNPQPQVPSPNLVVVPVDASGSVCLFSERTTDLIVDVTGWFTPSGDTFHEITPVRALDSRSGPRPGRGTTVRVPVAGAQVHGSAVAVAATVTVTQAAASGFVTAYPCGEERPPTSTNNVLAGRDRAAAVLIGLGDGGELCVYTDIAAHLVVDVTGWFGPDLTGDSGLPMNRLLAARVADTRSGPGQIGAFASGEQRRYQLLDRVPLGTTAVQLQITTTSPQAAGYLAVYPCSGEVPLASSVNYTPGPLSESTLVTVGLGVDGEVCVLSSAPTDVVIDLFGAYGSSALLRSLVASPLLTQSPQVGQRDHTIRCSTGGGTVTLAATAVAGARVAIEGGAAAPSAQWSGARAEDGLVHLSVTTGAGLAEEHWIRCLPHDFPQLNVQGHSPTPGWYAASFLPGGPPFTTGNFAFILDEYGVPVWYKRLRANQFGVGVWTNGSNEIAVRYWTGGGFPVEGPPYGGIELYALDGSHTGTISMPNGGNTGWHELLTLPNGNRVVVQYVEEDPPGTISGTCSRVDTGQQVTPDVLIHSDVVELSPDSTSEVWRWSTETLSPDETENAVCFDVDPGSGFRWGLDLTHVNAVDVFPDGDYLVTMRHTNAVYRVDRPSKTVEWKLGGTTVPAVSLTLVGDALNGPNAAHDARVLPNGNITLHDNRPFALNSTRPRAVEYAIDEGADTATLVWSYTSPNPTAGTLGSVRRQPDGGTVIGWGAAWNPWLEELDAAGNRVMAISVPAPSHTFYRAVKLPAETYDRTLLRSLAGGQVQTTP